MIVICCGSGEILGKSYRKQLRYEQQHNIRNIFDVCANCGKGEEAGIDLKACAACKLVKYCSRDCQAAHRPQHKKECKKKAKELHDEKMFTQPPPLEDCPICMIRLPVLATGRTYMACCGKIICCGCIHAPVYDDKGNISGESCPFCRRPPPKSDEQLIKRYEKRLELNDAEAMCNYGFYSSQGMYGLPKNQVKALELWHRAGDLGDAKSYCDLGYAHTMGLGVERDEKKAKYYNELAATRGDIGARCILGSTEASLGNMDRALKHFMIAAKAGSGGALATLREYYKEGYATKDDFSNALQSYQAYVDEVKTDQRDKAATAEGRMYYGGSEF